MKSLRHDIGEKNVFGLLLRMEDMTFSTVSLWMALKTRLDSSGVYLMGGIISLRAFHIILNMKWKQEG
jgi:hypothetical protein